VLLPYISTSFLALITEKLTCAAIKEAATTQNPNDNIQVKIS